MTTQTSRTKPEFDHAKYRKLLETLAMKAGYSCLGDLSEAATGSRTLLYGSADPSRRRGLPRLDTLHAVATTVGVKASDILRTLGY